MYSLLYHYKILETKTSQTITRYESLKTAKALPLLEVYWLARLRGRPDTLPKLISDSSRWAAMLSEKWMSCERMLTSKFTCAERKICVENKDLQNVGRIGEERQELLLDYDKLHLTSYRAKRVVGDGFRDANRWDSSSWAAVTSEKQVCSTRSSVSASAFGSNKTGLWK